MTFHYHARIFLFLFTNNVDMHSHCEQLPESLDLRTEQDDNNNVHIFLETSISVIKDQLNWLSY